MLAFSMIFLVSESDSWLFKKDSTVSFLFSEEDKLLSNSDSSFLSVLLFFNSNTLFLSAISVVAFSSFATSSCCLSGSLIELDDLSGCSFLVWESSEDCDDVFVDSSWVFESSLMLSSSCAVSLSLLFCSLVDASSSIAISDVSFVSFLVWGTSEDCNDVFVDSSWVFESSLMLSSSCADLFSDVSFVSSVFTLSFVDSTAVSLEFSDLSTVWVLFCTCALLSSSVVTSFSDSLIFFMSNASPLSWLLTSSFVIVSNSAACASLPIPKTSVAPTSNDAVPTVNFLIEYLFNLFGNKPCLFPIFTHPKINFFTTLSHYWKLIYI